MSKQAKKFNPNIKWWKIIMWAFMGFTFTISGTGNFIISEIGGLIAGVIRFGGEWERTQHRERHGEAPRKYHEWQTVMLAFIGMSLALASLGALGVNIGDGTAGVTIIGLAVPLIAGVFALLNYLWQMRPATEEVPDINKPMSKRLEKHYQESGLSESDVNVFRETMASASKSIHQLENNVQGAPELQDILAESDTMNVIHGYFRAIVDQPQRMNEASPFLYEQLPNLADLTRRYAIIQRHQVKTEDTYLVLSQAKDTLEKLCKKIQNEYTDFVKRDLEDLDTTVELTKRQLDSETKEPSEKDETK
ncbi:5-bromo-4-chloroindolyl phosphate hydrolysis family protein [Lacticaseibacillus pabuli]|uniref:5-bromo-4-chloroindolyl phosphate hydrolysis family protein n=1 Tax=Lacticaseibacillus pabuli TaxID=3025672 RepID=A0ABY7WNF6_9LACO|nr:5-bromo-4-chloroindolyl phosphate hydrolysis family protein [Lacticaseibacillus sp. KACC 23028]WDF81661.1 5-bromo-4-chloroindolyl phosphate hydrolysis family protein [Lacticaseibacillus sp. KACC 23028]